MFRNAFHTGFLSIYYAIGSKPLQIWDVQGKSNLPTDIQSSVHPPPPLWPALISLPFFAAKDGTVESLIDEELESTVLDIQGVNISTTLISCPVDPHKTLGIKLPWLVFLVKNVDEHFSLEIEIVDDKKYKRRFRASTFQVCFTLKISRTWIF